MAEYWLQGSTGVQILSCLEHYVSKAEGCLCRGFFLFLKQVQSVVQKPAFMILTASQLCFSIPKRRRSTEFWCCPEYEGCSQDFSFKLTQTGSRLLDNADKKFWIMLIYFFVTLWWWRGFFQMSLSMWKNYLSVFLSILSCFIFTHWNTGGNCTLSM